MDSDITPQQLIAVNFQYGTIAKSLKTLAFSDLSAKALFPLNRPLTIEETTKRVSQLIGIPSISRELVKNGLETLKDENKVKQKNNKWILCDNSRTQINKEILSNCNIVNNILTTHFPRNIDAHKLAAWFNDTLADLFSYSCDEWVQSICKGVPSFSRNIKTIDEILDRPTKKHGLNKYTSELKNSFLGFLDSDKPVDQNYLTNIGFAMFSARLVAADVGADPIAIEELRNTTFFVDTNFLFAIQLENRRLTPSLETLGKALLAIEAKLVFIDETKDEYMRVWSGAKNEVLKLFELYPDEVVRGADDDFVSTAIVRGCSDKASFERFFQSIEKIPCQIEKGPPIGLLQYKEIIEETEKAKKDMKLQERIQNLCLELRPYWNKKPKSVSALEHDASLIYVSEFERKSGNKNFILTLDRSLQACCAERAGKHEIPSAICLEGLIQILALNNAGPGLKTTNFAPLLTSIIRKRCIPTEHMYSIQDLHWLYSIQKNIVGFKPEKIKKIALEVTKARLAGKTSNDEKLQLTINRFYQEEVRNNNRIIEESIARAVQAEKEVKSERLKIAELEKKLQEKEKKEVLLIAKRRLRKALFLRIPAILIASVLAFKLVSLVLSALHRESILDFIIALCTLISTGYGFLTAPIKEYFKSKKSLM